MLEKTIIATAPNAIAVENYTDNTPGDSYSAVCVTVGNYQFDLSAGEAEEFGAALQAHAASLRTPK